MVLIALSLVVVFVAFFIVNYPTLPKFGISMKGLHAQELYDDHGGFHNDGQRLLKLTPEEPRELAAEGVLYVYELDT